MRSPLPTGLHNARDFPLECHLTEMDTAQTESTNVRARATTNFARVRINELAAIANADLELAPGFTGDHRFFCHRRLPLILLERHSEQGQQTAAFFITLSSRDNRDFHATHFVDFVVLNLREHQLFA